MRRVVTVLCHGTNFHRYQVGELVAELGRRLEGTEIKATGIGTGVALTGDFIINEGPGSKSGKKDAATPGTVNPLLEVKKGVIAKNVDRRAIETSAERDLRALNDAVQRSKPHSLKLVTFASAEAERRGMPRSAGLAYAQHIYALAQALAGPIGSAADHLADAYAAFDPRAVSESLTEERVEFAQHFYGEGLRSPFAIEGSATGAGWDDNVHKTVGRIANLGELPEVVNLLGWSRGGITCVKIANKLAEVFPQIKVNIFAVDPVYGGTEGGLADDVSNVPESVQELWVVLSMHERRKTFKPQAEAMFRINPSKTQAYFLPMPGGHDQQVELKRGGPSAEVTWHLAYTSLVRWGTRFKQAPIAVLSPAEVCRKYAQMSLRLDQYKSEGTSGIGNWVIGMGFADRHLPRDPNLPSGYFLNMHHWSCFRTQFPTTAKFFLSSHDQAILVKAVQEELKREPLIHRSIEAYYAALPGRKAPDTFVRSRL